MIASQFPQHIEPKVQVASCVVFSENENGTVLSTNTIGELKTMKRKIHSVEKNHKIPNTELYHLLQ